MSYGDDYGDASERGIPSQTRTHLPDDPRSEPRRGSASPRRSLVTMVSVVLILIAAIVFANRAEEHGGGAPDAAGGESDPAVQPTSPSGETPVASATGGVPTGHPQTEQGAESAAANYAVALGGADMFQTAARHSVIDTVYAEDLAAQLKTSQDQVYSAEFLKQLGLDADGNAPAGMTFVSRTVPVGTNLTAYDESTATVSVWYTALIGMAGEGSRDPIRTDWRTWTFDLAWQDGDWKITADTVEDGPAPVPGDIRASTSNEIADAIEGFGGFTYAR